MISLGFRVGPLQQGDYWVIVIGHGEYSGIFPAKFPDQDAAVYACHAMTDVLEMCATLVANSLGQGIETLKVPFEERGT